MEENKNNILSSKIARTMMYTLFIGGLLAFSSSVTWLLWNNVIIETISASSITMLESVGIVAILYVIWFGYLYASKTEEVEKAERRIEIINDEVCACTDEIESSRVSTIIKTMTAEEKIALKREIAKCCGLPTTQDKNNGNGSASRKKYPTSKN